MRAVWIVVAILVAVVAGLFIQSWWSGGGLLRWFADGLDRQSEEAVQTAAAVVIEDPGAPLHRVTLVPGVAELAMDESAPIARHTITVYRERNGEPGLQMPSDGLLSTVSGTGASRFARAFGFGIGDGDSAVMQMASVEFEDGSTVRYLLGEPVATWPPTAADDWQVVARLLDDGHVVERRVLPEGGDLELRVRTLGDQAEGAGLPLSAEGPAGRDGRRVTASIRTEDGARIVTLPAAALTAIDGDGLRITVRIQRDGARGGAPTGLVIRVDPAD